MAFLTFSITSPATNAVVGRSVAVTGRIRATGIGYPLYSVEEIGVAFVNGAEQPAQRAGVTWTAVIAADPSVPGGTGLRIVATARGMVTPNEGTPEEPVPGDPVPFEVQTTVDVRLDGSVPDVLTIDSLPSPVTTQPGVPYLLDASGTAGDVHSGISAVRLKVDNGPFVDVVDVVDNGAGLKRWRQKAVELSPGVHQITVQAVDGTGNASTAQARILVRLPFEPGDVEQVFQPTRYLLDLTEFARRYVDVDGQVGVLNRTMLAARFHQPYDRLVRTEHYEEATRSVAQARLAVEVMRGRLGGPAPHEVDQRFRGQAYQTFLRALGTSYEELRLARTADAVVRVSLAERLGIGLAAVRPDRLDELTISPDTVTDDALETLAGYRSTVADPLRPTIDDAKVLLWRRDALRARWQHEDEGLRDSADGPRPVIDPDLIGEDHIRVRQPGDTAFVLWTERRAWIADTETQIRQVAQPGPDALARFDQAVLVFIGTIDLAALATQDAEGVDIQPDLAPWELALDAFRFLARARALLTDGVLLAGEWDDIVAILLQVAKRRQYRAWRLSERRANLVLEPATFVVPAGATRPAGVSPWRARAVDYAAWRATLTARASTATGVGAAYQRTVDATEAAALPELRDALIGLLVLDPETPDAAADRLTRELMIDLRADAATRTTRTDQALQTLQAALFSARAGRLGRTGTGPVWTVEGSGARARDFDREWSWMGGMRGWLSAIRVFAYPDNQLLPSVYVADAGLQPAPTRAYLDLIEALRSGPRLTPDEARRLATKYLEDLDSPVLPDAFVITDQLTNTELVARQAVSRDLYRPDVPHLEIFWLIPMALAAKLQEVGQFQAALDWYQTIFAYDLAPEHRRIYEGLTREAGITSSYDRAPEWLIEELNPHGFARSRRNCYTRATIMAIAGCYHGFADTEFTRGTGDGNARARALYETAADLLALPEALPETDPDVPFPANPVWESLRQYGQAGLAKIHQGLNIAGVSLPGTYESFLPSQYRYGVLVERAKNLVTIAQQVEATYLSALEQRDGKTYDALRARQDLRVAAVRVNLQDAKVTDATAAVGLAELQRDRAQIQEDHFDEQIRDGLSGWEQLGLTGLTAAAVFHGASVAAFSVSGIQNAVVSVLTLGLFGDTGDSFGQALSAAASAASTGAQVAQTWASYERREQEWRLQKSLAVKDGEIAAQQIQMARNQRELAIMEWGLSMLQVDHAVAVATFLATRFTNAELYEWMIGVLSRVYAFFLQQATALARLAEAQLAFERQELPAGLISADYWRDEAAGATAPDRRGLTGSVRLLADVHRLDQYAFDTDRRKLHMTQTFAISQIGAFELQRFRDTGVLTFATAELLFDREFPGHYLRLIKQVSVSLVALIPSGRGVRATLSASGVSRTVVARGPFDTVSLRRPPESIAFTSPTNATGLFDLEPETGLLLPFEGMGVDTVWRLELPKAANPFDYRMIADVLFTVRYTALDSFEYRRQVVRHLDRRFSGDRTFSVRNQFPDAWYELNNPDTVEPDRRMRVALAVTTDDLPPHVDDLRVEHLSLFVMRADALADELTITSVSHVVAGQTVASGPVTTVGGIVSTRRPSGAAWHVHAGAVATGDWEIAIEDSPIVRSWFTDDLVQDLVLVVTLAGTTPAWP